MKKVISGHARVVLVMDVAPMKFYGAVSPTRNHRTMLSLTDPDEREFRLNTVQGFTYAQWRTTIKCSDPQATVAQALKLCIQQLLVENYTVFEFDQLSELVLWAEAGPSEG